MASNSRVGIERVSRERRAYFRIDDDIYLSYRLIEHASLQSVKERAVTGSSGTPSIAESLNDVSRRLSAQLKSLKSKHPSVARTLILVNEKLDLLMQFSMANDPESHVSPNKQVNISASGIAFCASEPVPENSKLELTIKLFPSFKQLNVIGEVVSVTEGVGRPCLYNIAVRFVAISDKARQALEKHVIAKELSRRRQTSR